MPCYHWFRGFIAAFLGLALAGASGVWAQRTDAARPAADQQTPPFDLQAPAQPPATFPAEGFSTDGVRAFFYEGPPFQGRPTRVFAYYGAPRVEPGTKVPALVLIHGGGGSAFDRWVRVWTARGYAAIAMDLCGCVPRGTYGHWERQAQGGPPGWDACFDQLAWPPADQWPQQAVSAVLLAHSLVRSFPEVDADRTGVTGISWGGYLTCLVAGVDPRFKFAVPVYGCGFLAENSAWLPRFALLPKSLATTITFRPRPFMRRVARPTKEYSDCNTWGAFQAYGDPSFVIDPGNQVDRGNDDWNPVAPEELVARIEQWRVALPHAKRTGDNQAGERYARRIQGLLGKPATKPWSALPEVLCALGRFHAENGDFEQVIAYYGKAIAEEDQHWRIPIMVIEQLANLEARQGEKTKDAASFAVGSNACWVCWTRRIARVKRASTANAARCSAAPTSSSPSCLDHGRPMREPRINHGR